MDSLKTLIDQKKYDLVIKLTEGSESANDLFYRISAFIYLGKYEDALFVIQDHQKILETNLVSLINAHINLLCALSRFDQAYSVLDYYANLPYQNQEVEELLRKMPEAIKLEEHKQTSVRFYDDEQIEQYLKSDKTDEVLIALDTIRNRDIFTFLPTLQEVLLNHSQQMVRSFALMLLVQKEVDRNLKMKSLNEIIDVNPKHLIPPFTGAIFNETVKLFDINAKDPTISQNAAQLFSEYAMYIYPREFFLSPKELSAIFILIAKKYASSPVSDEKEYFNSLNLDNEKLIAKTREIESYLSSL